MCNNTEMVDTIIIKKEDTDVREYFLQRKANLKQCIYNESIFYVGMGEIAISPQGNFDLWSPGFSGCTGVVICPKDKNISGGIIGHIKQGAGPSTTEHGKEGWYKYILSGITTCIDMVIDKWRNIDVVLFKGEPYLHDLDLVKNIELHYPNQNVTIHDCRIEESCKDFPDRPECNLSELFFDTKNKQLFMYKSLDADAKNILDQIEIFSREDSAAIALDERIDANDSRIYGLKNHMHLIILKN